MLLIRGITDNCPKSDDGAHVYGGHGDPRYLWCGKCQQEKRSNSEFIAWDTEREAQCVVGVDRVDFTSVEIDGTKVHIAT